MKKYIVALVEEYPVFEPAEGRCYRCREVRKIRFKTRKEARKNVQERATRLELELRNPDYAHRFFDDDIDSIPFDASIGIYKKNPPKSCARVSYWQQPSGF